jgi:DNA helicase IV
LSSAELSQELVREQDYVTLLYGRLDALRETASGQLRSVLLSDSGTHQARSERDARAGRYSDEVARLNAVEERLCFGRLDFQADGHHYIGRIGIFDEEGHEPLLVDWRAPIARAFYLATAASPDGVRRRRHIRTVGRTVVRLDDEVLDLDAAHDGQRDGLTGEAALMAAVNAGRTGRMGDIVETIQAEQDRIIRSPRQGVLVVQGAPGTGKTAVALHRAAYLLYSDREQLTRRGVLIVGPNTTFLRYIGDVLPSLGETGVLLSTVGGLFPGIRTSTVDEPVAAAVKGGAGMAAVLAAAVRDRQRVPDAPVEVLLSDTHAGFGYQRETVTLEPEAVARAREKARRTDKPHNLARPVFVEAVLDALAWQVADRLGDDPYADDPLGEDDAPGEGASLLAFGDVAAIRTDLSRDADLAAALDDLWPVLTPRRLLAEWYADPAAIERATPDLTPDQRAALHRPLATTAPADAAAPGAPGEPGEPGEPAPVGAEEPAPLGGWTVADVPLLDEAAELLGEDTRREDAAAERAERLRQEYAQGVLDVLAGSRSLDDEEAPELLAAQDLVDAGHMPERHEEADTRTAAERAAADRTWVFGHVIVDEAQELSEMAWRLLMRRCPSRSMTLVGDVAQTGSPAGATSWQQVLAPYVGDRWRLERLTVNYRMPSEIAEVAADVLAELDPTLESPTSVRSTGVEPWHEEAAPSELVARVATLVEREAAARTDGRLAVLAPTSLVGAIQRAIPGSTLGDDPDSWVAVLDVARTKGLEFDSVLLVEPAELVSESLRGMNDLYVALTRPTQRLGVVHTGPLPKVLDRLSAGAGDHEVAEGLEGLAGREVG